MPTPSRAAVQLERGGPLVIRTIDVADPGPGEVLIRVAASGLCHSDLFLMESAAPPMPFALPAIHGHEAIGRVIAVGEGTRASVGDVVMPYVLPDCGICVFCTSGRTNMCVEFARAMRPDAKSYVTLDGRPVASVGGMGTFSEYLCIRDDQVTVVNSATPAVPGCCVACAVTTGVASAMIDAKVHEGASVVVFGAGGVGLNVIQGAKLAGAAIVIAVDINPAKEAAAKGVGADYFLRADAGDIAGEVHRITDMGADYAFETVGTALVLRQALASLHAGGYARLVRLAADADPGATLPLSELSGKHFGSALMGGAKRQDVSRYANWLVDGTLQLENLVSHQVSLENINDGFNLIKQNLVNRVAVVFDKAL